MRPVPILVSLAVLLTAASIPALAQESDPLPDASDHRLFVGPTGRTLPGGEGYVGVFELFFPTVEYGVTNRIQVGGAVPVIPEVALETLVLTAKVGLVDTPIASVSAGTMTLVTGEGGGAAIGVFYGVGTFGGESGGVTVGAGYPFYATGEDSEVADEFVTLLGGDWRVGEHVKLVTENYFVPGEPASLASAGVRIFGERIAVDLGLAGVNDDGDAVCCLPVVNLTYAFGGER